MAGIASVVLNLCLVYIIQLITMHISPTDITYMYIVDTENSKRTDVYGSLITLDNVIPIHVAASDTLSMRSITEKNQKTAEITSCLGRPSGKAVERTILYIYSPDIPSCNVSNWQ